jgi:phage tail-like protein
LTLHSQRLLGFLPDIYHTDFMSRFLALFESILMPIEWNIGNFDIFLMPSAAPQEFLPWLAGWLDLRIGSGWDESKQRRLLSKAHKLYARRGTPGALKQVLYIYLGEEGDEPVIVDQAKDLEPFTFKVILPVKAGEINEEAVRQIIDEFKPVYTTYTLKYKM